MERLPATLLLMGTALVVTIIFAIPIGIIAAVKQYSWTDKIITTFATIGYAIPSFLLGIYVWYLGGIVLRDLTGSRSVARASASRCSAGRAWARTGTRSTSPSTSSCR